MSWQAHVPAWLRSVRPSRIPPRPRAALGTALPFAAILAATVGAILFAGANLSTAFPSAQKPFGWPGTATFDNGVAMVRPELLLATSALAAVWGSMTLRRLEPRTDRMSAFWTHVAVDVPLMWAGVLAAALIGKNVASNTPDDAIWAFTTAHGMLATAFYLLGLAISVAFRRSRLAAPVTVGAWIGFVAIYENLVRWQTFRQAGYYALKAGDFPGWFYAAQALSPVAGYRGILILWRKGFRDGTEHAVLDNAVLPAWMTPMTFVGLMALLWVAVPLAYASIGWWTRGAYATQRSTAGPVPAADSSSPGATVAIGSFTSTAPAAPAPATDGGLDNAPATDAMGARPARATRRNAASKAGTSSAASGAGDAGSRSTRPPPTTGSGLPDATGSEGLEGPGSRNP